MKYIHAFYFYIKSISKNFFISWWDMKELSKKIWTKPCVGEISLVNTKGGAKDYNSEAEMYGWYKNWYENDKEAALQEILKGTGTFTAS